MNTLKRLRVLRELTQENLAKLSGVSRPTVQAYERGQSISVKSARKLAAFLGVEWTIFFADDAVIPEQTANVS
jgi:transcriptional regulator with XRE-family HTH domain